MPASRDFTTWGPQDDPLAIIKLPVTYYSRESTYFPPFPKNDASNDKANRMMPSDDRRCKLTILTDGPTDTFSRYQFWTAAVALTELCVKGGQAGLRTNLGESSINTRSDWYDTANVSNGRAKRPPFYGAWSCIEQTIEWDGMGLDRMR